MFERLEWAVIETTSRCNIDCKNCWRVQAKDFKGVDMDIGLFKHIIDQLPAGTWTNLFMDGEPFCNPYFGDLVKLAQDQGLKVCFSTNGMSAKNIYEPVFKQFLSSQVSGQLLFSIDGYSREVAETYRSGSDWGKVNECILEAIRIKRGSSSKFVDIGVRMCDRGQEWAEIEGFVDKYLSWGADFVMVCKELGLGNKLPYERMYPCKYSSGAYIVINALGEMILCERAASNKIVVGDASKEPIADIYARIATLKPDYCRRCEASYTGKPFKGMVVMDDGKMYHFKEDYFQRIFTTRKNMDAIKL